MNLQSPIDCAKKKTFIVSPVYIYEIHDRLSQSSHGDGGGSDDGGDDRSDEGDDDDDIEVSSSPPDTNGGAG